MRISDWSSDVCSSDRNDLREVIAALKISGELERIGDYAKNVAKRTMVLNQLAPHESARSIPRMAKLVQAIIKDVLDAYANHDPDRAIAVLHRDEEVDEMYPEIGRASCRERLCK